MKKLFLMVVCAIMAFGATAQSQGLRFGLKAGGNFSGQWGGDIDKIKDKVDAIDGKFGYQVGVTAEYGFGNGFAISPEVLFTSQGARLGYKDDKACAYMNYIAVPVMFKYYPADCFSINLGPEFDFNVYDKIKGEDFKDAVNAFNFGIAVGASYYINSNIYVDARYTMGVTNTLKDNDLIKFALGKQFDAKTYNVSLGIGYRF